MAKISGVLLWNRMRITLEPGANEIDTEITQVSKAIPARDVPLGVMAAIAPADGTEPASRIQVVPLLPSTPWANISHGEPYFNTTTGTIHVVFTNAGPGAVSVNVLIWDPHSMIGPGQADTYVAEFVPGEILGASSGFAVLGAETITNTGDSLITGDLGLDPGSSVTGFPPGVLVGTEHINDAEAIAAQAAAEAAYVQLAAMPTTQDLTGQDLGGLTLGPGVYNFDTSAGLTGTLELDAGGDPNAVFVFKIGSTLTTAASSLVDLLNGALADNVFWQIGSSGTLGGGAGVGTEMKGTLIALVSMTLVTDANVEGRVFALNGAVTLDDNNVTVP